MQNNSNPLNAENEDALVRSAQAVIDHLKSSFSELSPV